MEKPFSMSARLAGFACAAALAASLAAPAAAQTIPASLMLPSAAAFVSQVNCSRATTSLGERILATPQLSKSAAILGGMSALEKMRLSQQTGASTEIQPYIPNTVVAPAARAIPQSSACSDAFSFGRRALPSKASASGNDILASQRIAIKQTMFDRDWDRVRGSGLSERRANRFIGEISNSDRMALITQVNRVTNQRIRYVEDRVQWGRADFWAGANATMRSGKGDCEDIAITKMHLLIAQGFRPEDLTLTIARDMIHGSDHAVLLVRHDGRYLLLDNITDRILDGSQANEYKPIFSYSDRKAWLHGYQLSS